MTAEPAPASDQSLSRRDLLAQVAAPMRNFIATEAGSAGLLLAAVAVAIVWANSPWSDRYVDLWSTRLVIRVSDHALDMDLLHWVNDGLMAIFFFVVGLELRREFSMGELTEPRRVVLPVIGAVGGLVVPALLYLAINPSGDEVRGWGIVIGTDTAFLLGALALVGPVQSTQLRVFLLTMTIIDDVLAIAIIGLLYSDAIHVWPLIIAAAALAVFPLLGRLGVWQIGLYAAAGIVAWIAAVESGLHPTIAGMIGGFLVAAFPPRRDEVERAVSLMRRFRQSPGPAVGKSAKQGLERAVSVNERMQERLHPWTSYLIVPIFALANAGIDLRGGVLGDALRSPVTWGVVVGLVGGKYIGIGTTVLGARRMHWGELPRGVGPYQVLGGAALSGIGFTVSLLIASLAFDSPELREQATVGVILAALLSFVVGWLNFRMAASLHGERTATLPSSLDRPVDPRLDHIRGRVDAPLTVVEYGDYECPFCAAATGVLADLRARFGDDLRYVFRHLPLAEIHPHAELAAAAAEAAGAQGRFWEMHDILFEHQGELELEDLLGYAGKLGLDVERFARDLNEGRFMAHVRDDAFSAEESGARGTPTFFIGVRRHVGPYDAATLAAELEASRQ